MLSVANVLLTVNFIVYEPRALYTCDVPPIVFEYGFVDKKSPPNDQLYVCPPAVPNSDKSVNTTARPTPPTVGVAVKFAFTHSAGYTGEMILVVVFVTEVFADKYAVNDVENGVIVGPTPV
jgi:hypothetical protein